MTPYHMLLLALQAFLINHGKTTWAAHVFSDTPRQVGHLVKWAIHHGFHEPL